MNRTEALEWLVENVTKWPVDGYGMRKIPNPPIDLWGWLYVARGEIVLFSFGLGDNSITQQDWLDATDNVKEKCDE